MTTLDETLEERGTRYGVFYDHAELSQALKDTMRGAPRYSELSADKKEALDMIVHKIARILNGDPNYADSWHDIGGYAKLVEDTLMDAVPCGPDDVVETHCEPDMYQVPAYAPVQVDTLAALAQENSTPRLFESSEFKNLSDLGQKTLAVKTSIFAAGAVLHFFEADYPKDRRPRQAIEAAEACVEEGFSKSTTDEALWSSDAADMAADAGVVGSKRTTCAAWAAGAARAAAKAAAVGVVNVTAWAADAVNTAEIADPSVAPKIREYLVKLLKEANAPSVKTVIQIFESSEFENLSELDRDSVAVKTAIFAARSVLHIFEADYPEDLSPRRAIEAAEACVLAEFSEEYSKVATARRLSAETAAMRTGGRKCERMVRRDAVYAAVHAADAVTGPAKWGALRGVNSAEKADPSVEPKIREYLVKLLKEASISA